MRSFIPMFRQFRFFGWSLVVLLAAILTISFYFQEGMFFDGITYSALGRNLYLGHGTFWKPYYNEFFNPFYNHPPLLYWILSKFYWILGDHMYVPKIYNAIVLVLTIGMIRSIWIMIDEKNKSIDWWPFILWFCTSVVFNTYRNTMLESTLSLFTLISILLLLRVVTAGKKVFIQLIVSSVFIFLGFMTKGFVALFPFGFILLYGLLFQLSFKKILTGSVLLIAGFGLCYFLIITLNADAKPYFDYYYNQHVFKAVSGNEAITSMGRYFLILQLLLELSPWILLSLVFMFFNKRFSLKVNYRWVMLFLLVGISASFPMFISPKQRTYYLLPSIPYFILGFSVLTQPFIDYLVSKIKPSRLFGMIAIVCLFAGTGYCLFFSQIKEKEADLIHDARILDAYFPDRTVLSSSAEMANNWTVVAYLSRVGVITPSDKLASEYILVTKGEVPVEANLSKMDLGLIKFDLYRKQ